MVSASCIDSSLYTSEDDVIAMDSRLGYCTSAAECLRSSLSMSSTEIGGSAIVTKLITLVSSSLQTTCLYLSADKVVESGICCKFPTTAADNSEIRPVVLPTNEDTLRTNTFEKWVQKPNEYLGKKKEEPSLMDRGHIFFRPGDPPLQERNPNDIDSSVIGDTSIKSEWEFDDYFPFPGLHPTHPPLPTHPPSLTDKPWWVSRSHDEVTTTTQRPFWMTKPTTPTRKTTTTTKPTTRRIPWWEKPKPTPKPTTRPTTTRSDRWWGQPTMKPWQPQWENQTSSWELWTRTNSTTTTTTTTTTKPLSTRNDYCTPSYFRSVQLSFTDSSNRITGGSSVVPHTFPWIAVLYHGSKHICGGSLISEIHVLTAAHCVASMSSGQMSNLRVIIGVHNLYSEESSRQDMSVKTVIRHKDYSRSLLYNDVAILSLTHPVKITPQVRPICLYSGSDNFADDIATVAGWGSLFEGGHQLDTPRKVDMRIWSNEDCRDAYGPAAPGGIVHSHLCAGKQGKDACSGDSGGPIIKEIGGVWQQIGVVSWGIGCGKAHYPGVYSRMSSFLPWITKVIEKY